jgi:hypothetical protein
MVPCPKCGVKREFQSKSGECLLQVYELDTAPKDVMEDVNRHAPAKCDCGNYFMVDFHVLTDGKPRPKSVSPPERDYKQELEAAEAGLQATTERCDEYRVKAEQWEAAYWALVKVVSR